MAAKYHVNGPAIVYVGTGGEGDPERLGVTVSGVRINYKWFHRLGHSDVSGDQMPAFVQKMGAVAILSMKLTAIDADVLDKLRKLGDAAAVGQLASTGLLLNTTGYTVSLWIDGRGDRPHKFHHTMLWEGEEEQVSTRVTEDDIQFYAWTPVDPEADTVLDETLFTYERPPGVA